MKRFLQKAVCLILLFLLALPAKAYASNGSGNMDGGGSGMGQGTSTNYWTPGYDGGILLLCCQFPSGLFQQNL